MDLVNCQQLLTGGEVLSGAVGGEGEGEDSNDSLLGDGVHQLLLCWISSMPSFDNECCALNWGVGVL